MNKVTIPPPRNRGALQRLWLYPTNLIGRLAAWILGCEKQEDIGEPATPGQLWLFPPHRFAGLGAIALGHVIIAERSFLSGTRGPWVLAHELSHTLQHDYLGPFYLPIHGLLQVVSLLMALLKPIAGFPPTHAYNPLERSFLCVPIDRLMGDADFENQDHPVLHAFGVKGWRLPNKALKEFP